MPRRCTGRLEAALSQAGFPLGLTVDELAAVSAVMASLGLFVVLVVQRPGSPVLVSLVVIAAGWLPFARVEALARRRGKHITRRLPAVLELIVMCMSAGLDLPRALRCVVESATDSRDPIVEELDVVIQELELGLTRREALLGLADRVPTPEVRELVNSIIQSEQKGVSLTKTLTIQSRTLKLGRSMSAEQAASGAALMLVGPMSLIFLCVIALLLGPVLLRTMSGGFDL
jgi:tight adherence protein C